MSGLNTEAEINDLSSEDLDAFIDKEINSMNTPDEEAENTVKDEEANSISDEIDSNNEDENTEDSNTPDEENTEEEENTNNENTEDSNTPDEENIDSDSTKEVLATLDVKGSKIDVTDLSVLTKLASEALAYKELEEVNNANGLVAETLKANKITKEDINTFIAAKNGDKKAIAKLLASNEVDPLDLDLDEATEYEAPNVQVDESEYKLNRIISTLQQTSTYDKLTQSLDTWDTSSHDELLTNPENLITLNDHIRSGVYDKVLGEVRKQKLNGNIPYTVPDIQAYKQVGIYMEQAGLLKEPDKTNSNSDTSSSTDNKTTLKQKLAKSAPEASNKESIQTETTIEEMEKLSDEEFMEKFNKSKII